MRAFIVSACRTPIGKFGGSLAKHSPADLAKIVTRAAIERAAGDSEEFKRAVDEVIFGNVLGAGHGMNISRQATLGAGLPADTAAYTVNKVCGSGLKAVTLAAGAIRNQECDLVIAGGTESMSQAGFINLTNRWGSKLGHSEMKDLIIQDGLTDAFHSCHMGITAENLAEKYEISRDEQDRFAAASQQKANLAIAQGHFRSEIVAVPLIERGREVGKFEVDEFPRADTTMDGLSKLKPAFKPNGTVTAGNSSGINDGAAALVIASERKVKELRLNPLAEIIGSAFAGVPPEVMGLGPVEAVKKLCTKTGQSLASVDCIESNEAFAAQSLAVSQLLKLDSAKVNRNGGAIALGHPIGASGARILVTLVHELIRTKQSLGLATLCVGGGQGIAILLKRCE